MIPCTCPQTGNTPERRVEYLTNKDNKLRGKVIEKYGSIAKFAEAVNLNYAKAYRLVTGSQDRSEKDIRFLIETLGIKDAEEIVSLFSLS